MNKEVCSELFDYYSKQYSEKIARDFTSAFLLCQRMDEIIKRLEDISKRIKNIETDDD